MFLSVHYFFAWQLIYWFILYSVRIKQALGINSVKTRLTLIYKCCHMQDRASITDQGQIGKQKQKQTFFFSFSCILCTFLSEDCSWNHHKQKREEMEGHLDIALPLSHVKIIQSILQAAGSFYSFIYYHTVIVNCLLFTSAGFSKLVLSNVTGGRALSIWQDDI